MQVMLIFHFKTLHRRIMKIGYIWLWHGLMMQRQLSHVYFYLMKIQTWNRENKTTQTSQMHKQTEHKCTVSDTETEVGTETERERENSLFAHLIETGFITSIHSLSRKLDSTCLINAYEMCNDADRDPMHTFMQIEKLLCTLWSVILIA